MIEENTLGGGRERIPRDEMDAFRYADGSRMERGDVVWVPGETGQRTYLIAGWDGRDAVLLRPALGGPMRSVEVGAVSRWMP